MLVKLTVVFFQHGTTDRLDTITPLLKMLATGQYNCGVL